ncbi:helix-turn-helix domain-containing protein [Halomicrobium salinisoli]|uniref:helix-turn-helix domain-containing protein n=1 Tax=Halomicrobium salinisoli TaxID=2878391 RepID=UPI001CF06C3F|nr:helix-turn-helix domain-containing protein [Halomicrobium salinisoli]
MKSLRLVLRHSAETIHPMHAFVCESPAVDREVFLEGRVHEGVETALTYVEGDREAYEAALQSRIDAEDYDVTPAGEEGFFLYVRQELDDAGQLLFDAFAQETLVIASPVEFRSDRTMRLTVVGHPDDLQAMLDALPEGVDADVRSIGDYGTKVGTALTDRQREALATAWDAGYYEVPRTAGIEDVADELDLAVSTVSDLLRRAESRLVAEALDEPR